jgi:uncharacterized protein (TIGR03437 family)
MVLGFCVVPPLPAQSQLTYSNQRVTTQAPPQSGCVIPPAFTSFKTSDKTVYLYFDAAVSASDALSADWLTPDGVSVGAVAWSSGAGTFCFPGANLDISNLPASRLGNWQSRVFNHGNMLFSIPFTVTAPASGGAPTIGSTFPTSAIAGASFTLTVKGANFGSDATILWNGTALQTFGQPSQPGGFSSQLSAFVVSSLTASPGTVRITVSSLGQTSSAISFTISAKGPGTPTCAVSPPVTKFLRADSLTELVPDTVIQCAGGVASSSTTVDLALYLNTGATSRLISGTTSEVLLLVNEPATRILATNAFLGQLSGNEISWSSVPARFDASGSLTLRIGNLRENLGALGYGVAVQALFAIDFELSTIAIPLPSIVLPSGLVGRSTAFDVRQCDDSGPGLITISEGAGLNTGMLSGDQGVIQYNLRFRELVPRGFTTIQQENGITLPTAPSVGTASQGTRLLAYFNNVPRGMQVYVTTGPIGPADSKSANAVLTVADSGGNGVLNPISGTLVGVCNLTGPSTIPMAPVNIQNGSGTATWEITSSDTTAFEQLSFGVALAVDSYTTPPITGGGLGPASAATSANSTGPIPRFFDTSVAQVLPIVRGLTFVGSAGGPNPPDQFIPASCSPAVSTTSGGNWLSAGSVAGGLNVSVRTAGLQASTYFGQIGCSGTSFTIVLNLVPSNVDPGPVVNPIGLLFSATQGGPAPPAQNVTLTNLTNQTISYTITLPAGSGTIPPSQPVTIPVTFNPSGLTPGVYTYDSRITFSDGYQQNLVFKGIVTRLLSSTALAMKPTGQAIEPRATSGCRPTRLVVVVRSLGQQINLVATFPVPITVLVNDDCHNPISAGVVQATYSSERTVTKLEADPGNAGTWIGLWNPTTLANNMTITVTANVPNSGLAPDAQTISANVVGGGSAPLISAGGVVNAASQKTPLALGGSISIYGANLADFAAPALQLPLGTSLGTATVFLSGRQLPLIYAGPTQINALIPYDLPPGAYSLKVQRANAVSSTAAVLIAGASPGVFSVDNSGTGQGAITNAVTGAVADSRHPVHAGDYITVYLTGIGSVVPVVDAAVAAPSEPPLASVIGNSVTATIGGIPATVAFAGLAPGFAGLGQVNLIVPSGVQSGDAVPVVVTAAGSVAPAVTISVR